MHRAAAVTSIVLGAVACSYPEFAFVPEPPSDASELAETVVSDTRVENDGAETTSCTTSCGGTCVDPTSDRLHCGGCDKPCAPGQPCSASTCAPLASCSAIRARFPELPDGTYAIDPDGAGGAPPFAAYCDMTSDGGGFTLALKLDGSKTTFAYASALWTNGEVLNPTSTNTDPVEAKFLAFSTVPFTELRLGMAEGATKRHIVIDLAASSLRAAFAGGPIRTAATRAKWFELLSAPLLQPNCNDEGINLVYTSGPQPRVRIGIITNEQTDCGTPDSYLGFGAELRLPIPCYDDVIPQVVVGNLARTECGGVSMDRTTVAFGYVYVR